MENSLQLPKEVRAILNDIAKIRRTILENAPDCLPVLAPVIVDAEDHVHAMWATR